MTPPILRLIRLEESFEHGTFGVLRFNAEVFCVTLEPPDIENAQNVSSIPAQQYTCERIQSPRYGDTFEVKNVPGRTHVLFHPGNTVDHTMGCVLLGQYFGKLRGDRAAFNSALTFREFMARLKKYDRCHLTIKEAY